MVKPTRDIPKEPEQEPVAIMREMLEVQGQHGNWNYDPYMHGLYNGMEYMVALAEKRGPKFRDAPDKWLAKYEVKRDNFNSTEQLTEATPYVATPRPQRPSRSDMTWVGLTDDETNKEAAKEEQAYGFVQGALWAEAKLKEKNT